MISVDIRDEQKIFSVNHRAVQTFLKEAIRSLLPGRSCRLSVALVEDEAIRRLNVRYLGKPHPTDVLAFSMREGPVFSGDASLLGDLMISTETALRNTKRFRSSLDREFALYLVHGVLHLLGYEDKTPSQKRRIRKEEKRVLWHCVRSVSLKKLLTA